MIAILSNIILFGLIVYFLAKRYKGSPIRALLIPALAFKVIAGLLLGWLYFYHYGYGDTIVFHQQAKNLSDLAAADFTKFLSLLFTDQTPEGVSYSGAFRSHVLVKILAVVHLLCCQNYWLSSVYFSVFSFLAFWAFADTLVKNKLLTKSGAGVLLFYPSVMLWSSGIIKESIAMGALMFISSFLVHWISEHKWKWSFLYLPVLVALVWTLKYYYLGVYVAVVVPFLITDWLKYKEWVSKYSTAYYLLLFCAIGAVTLHLHPNFYPDSLISVIMDSHDDFQRISTEGQAIQFMDLQATLPSVLVNFPLAVWSGVFRLGIWEADSWIEVLTGIENLALLVLTVWATYQWLVKEQRKLSLLALVVTTYCILLAGFLALSAPNFGTLVRYKVGFMPFLLLLVGQVIQSSMNYSKAKVD